MIIILDFGSQVAHLISRKVRELGVYAELVPHNISPERIQELKPDGIILSGGPKSVYEKNAPKPDKKIFGLGTPILGICYGHQLIAQMLGGEVSKGKGEYGKTTINVKDSLLLKKFGEKHDVWMSHADFVSQPPKNFAVDAESENGYITAMSDHDKKIFGVQFHPEVHHTLNGSSVFEEFIQICGARKDWALKDFAQEKIKEIRKIVRNDKVLLATSGGVDSSVTALLLHKALGDKLTCVFVDTGLLRKGEAEQVKNFFANYDFHVINASTTFLEKLSGVTDPEEKRKIIGQTFIKVFEEKSAELGDFKFLGQGTIYPDRVESATTSKQSSLIKTHHNVGGLPQTMNLELIEPLKDLYKDEVRKVGKILGLPETMLNRHPFPGPGLAVRIIGEVTREKIEILRNADEILLEELKKNGLYNAVWQAFPVLLSDKSTGVMGDARSYQNIIALRAVNSVDAMTATASELDVKFLKKVASRIVNEVEGVNRVLYDLTDKPPATIEFE